MTVVILLGGGEKSGQRKDITSAKRLWKGTRDEARRRSPRGRAARSAGADTVHCRLRLMQPPPHAANGYNRGMAKEEHQGFTGFGLGAFPKVQAEEGVFILVVVQGGSLTAAAYATERAAMQAAVESAEAEWDDDEERLTVEDRFTRAQRASADAGDILEIVPSPVYGA